MSNRSFEPRRGLSAVERSPAVAKVRRAVATAADRADVLRPGERIVVACSGGPDSTALLDALVRLAPPRSWRLAVAHVDHGLRPGSGQEALHVEALAVAHGVPFHPLRVAVSSVGSLQGAARQARYEGLRELAVSLQASVIACGHTADDQAETVLMRALSGATPRALCAMSPRSGDVARPLLRVWHDDIVAYCTALGLTPLRDPSNGDGRFLRSRVRHELLPSLEAVFPAARRRLVALADHQQRLCEEGDRTEDPC